MRRFLYIVTGAAVFATVAAAAETPERPEKFPDVPLGAKSVPRYASVALDTEGTEVAYVLFDGNVEDGYDKMFVWVPDDDRYGKPKSIKSDDEKIYPPFGIKSSTSRALTKEEVTIAWSMRWYIHSGRHRVRNYRTGEMEERDVGNYPVFHFNVDFERKPPRMGIAAQEDSVNIDLGIRGYLKTSMTWTNCPNPVLPWKELDFYVTPEPAYERGKSFLRFKGRLSYYYWWPCRIGQISDQTEITLTVSPYLEDPVYSDKVNAADLFGEGVLVELPYGWYDCSWDIKDVGLKVVPRDDRRRLVHPPFALPKPGG